MQLVFEKKLEFMQGRAFEQIKINSDHKIENLYIETKLLSNESEPPESL